MASAEPPRFTAVEFFKYAEDKWMGRRTTPSWLGLRDRTELNHQSTNQSILSAHSCVEEKNQILRTLTQYGIETTVDRTAKKERIRDWIQSSWLYRSQTWVLIPSLSNPDYCGSLDLDALLSQLFPSHDQCLCPINLDLYQ